MNDEQFDSAFQSAPKMPAELADKVRAQIRTDTRPAKPLPGPAILGFSFFTIVAAASLLFAATLQFKGLHVLPAVASLLLLAALGLAAVWGGIIVARSMRPASGRLQTWLISGLAFAAYELLVHQFFQNYAMGAFVSQGIKCLLLGILCGLVVAVPVWLFVRKGFIVDPVQCGAAIGLIGGLSGSIFLTLHCPVYEAPHALVWHAAVMVVCVSAGALVGRLSPLFR